MQEKNKKNITAELRPITLLRRVMQRCPNLSEMVNAAISKRDSVTSAAWPKWCFIPRGVWGSCLYSMYGAEYLQTVEGRTFATTMQVVGTWRYGQGVYEFAPEIYEALTESDMSGKLPADVFLRLPEWCIYVPTPGLTFYGEPLNGFFAMLDYVDDGTNRNEHLIISTDRDDGLLTVPIAINAGMTLVDAINAVLGDSASMSNTDYKRLWHTLADELTPILSLLLYLCSDAPEIDDARTPGLMPYRSYPKKIKGVIKMFPATAPHVWTVGAKASEALRTMGYGVLSDGGGKKRPHLRRGHWHGYWTGARDGDRTFGYKWLPPMIVAARD